MGLFLALFSTFLKLVSCTFVARIAVFGFGLLGLTEIEGLLDILFGCEDGNGGDIVGGYLWFYFFAGLIHLRVFAFLLTF